MNKIYDARYEAKNGAVFYTNGEGDGLFVQIGNEEKQLRGTCQFSIRGLKYPVAKLRRAAREYVEQMDEEAEWERGIDEENQQWRKYLQTERGEREQAQLDREAAEWDRINLRGGSK